MSLYLRRVHARIFSADASKSGFEIRLLAPVIYTESVFGGEGNACEPILRFPVRAGFRIELCEIWFIFM